MKPASGVTGSDLGGHLAHVAFGGRVLKLNMVLLELFVRQGTAGYIHLAYGDNAFSVLQVVQRIDLAGGYPRR